LLDHDDIIVHEHSLCHFLVESQHGHKDSVLAGKYFYSRRKAQDDEDAGNG
jgi:tetrahydromethanopterin S-methyltransferase subunit H